MLIRTIEAVTLRDATQDVETQPNEEFFSFMSTKRLAKRHAMR